MNINNMNNINTGNNYGGNKMYNNNIKNNGNNNMFTNNNENPFNKINNNNENKDINNNNIFALAFPEIAMANPNISLDVIGGETSSNNNINNNSSKNENINNQIPNIINNKGKEKEKEKEKESEINTKAKLDQLQIGLDSIINKLDEKISNIDINEVPEDMIKIKFTFLNDKSILFDAKINETFKAVVERFKSKNQEIMNKYAPMALHNLKSIKFDKTLLENRIINKEEEVFFFKEIDDKNNYEKLDEKDKEQLNIYLDEFKANKFSEYYSTIYEIEDEKNIHPFNIKFDLSEFVEFVLHKETIPGIYVRDHEDRLVYSLTPFDWKCNVCKKNYSKNEPKYYCSICDYNMCDNCVDAGHYDKKRTFPKSIPPCNINCKNKSLKAEHSHDLVFCRTSRCVLNETYWFCNECQKGYNPEDWGFYCTLCDYDLCSKCAEKYIKN
jgi:hypothetical protein